MAVMAADSSSIQTSDIFWEWLQWAVLRLPLRFFKDDDALSWKWFASAFVVSVICTLIFSPNLKKSWRRLKAHLGSKRVHKEFSLDMKFMLFKVFYDPLKLAIYGGFFVKATKYFETSTVPILQKFVPTPLVHLDDTFGSISLALFIVMAWDFSYYVFHWASHYWFPLWDLHAVHHRARYLNPFTKYRVHPLSSIVDFFMSSFMVGVLLGFYKAFVWYPGVYPVISHMQLNLLFIAFWGHLRHSQYWLSFGKYFSYIIMSPAMHQIHHSRRPEHMGKNLGVVFSVWDYAFGTLYIPQKQEKLWIGPGSFEHREPWTFRKEMFQPIISLKERWVHTFGSERWGFATSKTRPGWIFAVGTIVVVGFLYSFYNHMDQAHKQNARDVRVIASDSGE